MIRTLCIFLISPRHMLQQSKSRQSNVVILIWLCTYVCMQQSPRSIPKNSKAIQGQHKLRVCRSKANPKQNRQSRSRKGEVLSKEKKKCECACGSVVSIVLLCVNTDLNIAMSWTFCFFVYGTVVYVFDSATSFEGLILRFITMVPLAVYVVYNFLFKYNVIFF